MVWKKSLTLAALVAVLGSGPVIGQDNNQDHQESITITIPSSHQTTIDDIVTEPDQIIEPISQEEPIQSPEDTDMTEPIYDSLPRYIEATDVFGITNGYYKTGLFHHNDQTFGGYIHVRMDDGTSGQLFNRELSFYIDAEGNPQYFAPDTRSSEILRVRPNDLSRAFEYAIQQELDKLNQEYEEVTLEGTTFIDQQPTYLETIEETFRRGDEIRRISGFEYIGLHDIDGETYATYRLASVIDNGQEMIPNIISYYINPEEERIEYFSSKPGTPPEYAQGSIADFYNATSIRVQPQGMRVRPAVVHLVEEAYASSKTMYQNSLQEEYQETTGILPEQESPATE